MTTNEHIKTRTIVNLSYNIIARLITLTLSGTTAIVLARHLGTRDYGIVGFAMILINFLQQFNDFGITSSSIQKEYLGEDELYTAFTIKMLLGLLILALSYGWGALSQKIFDNPAVKWVVIVLAANLSLAGLGFLPATLMTRDLKFKRLTIQQIGAQVAASAVAITTAYLGLTYWSIVLGNVAATIASVTIVFLLCPVPFKLKFDIKAAQDHLKFGGHLFFAGLMTFILFNADNFMIGAVSGTAALGIYSVAFDWSTKASDLIGQSISKILLSTFSRVQRDTERLKRGYLSILEYVSFAAILANVLLIITSRELLVLVLGGGTTKWLPALLPLNILCVYGIIRAALEPVGSMIVAVGRPSLISKSNAIVAGLQLVSLYPALRYFGTEGVAAAVTISYAVQFLVYFPALYNEIGITFSAVFRSIWHALFSGCALALFGFCLDRLVPFSWLSMIIKLLLGSALYLSTYGLITGWKIFKDGRAFIAFAIVRKSQPSTRNAT